MGESDKELLEMAAKAAGIEIMRWVPIDDTEHIPLVGGMQKAWNPLADDGDEARLEMTLAIDVSWHKYAVAMQFVDGSRVYQSMEFFVEHEGNAQKARRYAGVKIAAAIGKAMP